jgi:hypothetical protein
MRLRAAPPVRAVSALAAAATLAAAPVATAAGLGPGSQAVVVRVVAQAAHDIGHNDWAFRSSLGDRYTWITAYLALAVLWLAASVVLRSRRLLLSTLGAELAAGVIALAPAAAAQWTNGSVGPLLVHASDLGSPWWSVPAALLAVGSCRPARLAAAGYAALLLALLLLPLPSLATPLLLAALPAAVALLPDEEPGERPLPGRTEPAKASVIS